MNKPKLTYFDAPVSRGEECRLALHVAGVDFEDVRIPFAEWPALKPKTPFGSLPLLDLPGRPTLAQSNAILVYLGRSYGLHPTDDFEAARHEAILQHAEDLRIKIAATFPLPEDEKRKARTALVETMLPVWAASAEKQLSQDGPFFAGSAIHVADIKLFVVTGWVRGGKLDHIPAGSFADYPKLNRVHDAVRDDARVKAWYAKTAK